MNNIVAQEKIKIQPKKWLYEVFHSRLLEFTFILPKGIFFLNLEQLRRKIDKGKIKKTSPECSNYIQKNIGTLF